MSASPIAASGPHVGRLAPSPTGVLHVGNARSLLWATLAARSRGGKLPLRVEDLVPGAHEQIAQVLADLQWLGLTWDDPGALVGRRDPAEYGPELEGLPAFVLQSDRAGLHAALLDRLVRRGDVYPCVCTRKDIDAAARAPHAEDRATRYPGTCRGRFPDLSAALRFEAARAARAGHSPLGAALRMRAEGGVLRWYDDILGPQACDVKADSGDFVVRRKDGTPAYMLAVVADDRAMGITEVVRGDDLAEVTAQQLLVHAALAGLDAGQPRAADADPALTPGLPRFCHVPLVFGDDGRRLAKRNRSLHVQTLRHEGVDPRQLRAFLAMSFGLPAEDDLGALADAYRQRFGASDFAEARSTDALQPIVFDIAELEALRSGKLPSLCRMPAP